MVHRGARARVRHSMPERATRSAELTSHSTVIAAASSVSATAPATATSPATFTPSALAAASPEPSSVSLEGRGGVYELGVASKFAPGAFHRTRLVYVCPRYVLSNESASPLQFLQSGTRPSGAQTVGPKSKVMFHWPAASKPRSWSAVPSAAARCAAPS